MIPIEICALTGYRFDKTVRFDNSRPLVVDYYYAPVGRARITLPTYQTLLASGQTHHPVLAGLCRNNFENNVDPPTIDSNFITTGIKNHTHPSGFQEKAKHMLRYLYNKGGKEYHEFNLQSRVDFTLCYASDVEEFNRIMKSLEVKYLIEWKDAPTFGRSQTTYYAVKLTESGIREIEKELPSIPLIGLVCQKISTGSQDVDESINHAKDLFFQEPRTMDKMRSACETLSYVLEPLRKDLEEFFKQRDVSDFFLIVNNFDIRHNKDTTKTLVHAEQLEWVFYSLLNTINTYTKLKRKLSQ